MRGGAWCYLCLASGRKADYSIRKESKEEVWCMNLLIRESVQHPNQNQSQNIHNKSNLRSIRDPLLCTRDDPVLSILRLRRGRLEAKDVGARIRLRHRQANEFLRAQDLRHDTRLQLGRAEVEHGREADDAPRHEAVTIAAGAATGDFLGDDELVEVVELSRIRQHESPPSARHRIHSPLRA